MLDIIPELLLVTGVVFLILMFLLNKILYKPLLNFMENRDKSIARDLEGAGKNSNDVLAYKEEAQKIILDAKFQANKIRESALLDAKESALKKTQEKKNQLEEEYKKFSKILSDQRDELKTALLAKMPILTDSISTKLSKI
jgi:F-type H+-transporting ATPase subunit b